MLAIEKVVEAAKGQTRLAEMLTEKTGKTITQANVWNWINRQGKTPADHVVAVSEIAIELGVDVSVVDLLNDRQISHTTAA